MRLIEKINKKDLENLKRKILSGNLTDTLAIQALLKSDINEKPYNEKLFKLMIDKDITYPNLLYDYVKSISKDEKYISEFLFVIESHKKKLTKEKVEYLIKNSDKNKAYLKMITNTILNKKLWQNKVLLNHLILTSKEKYQWEQNKDYFFVENEKIIKELSDILENSTFEDNKNTTHLLRLVNLDSDKAEVYINFITEENIIKDKNFTHKLYKYLENTSKVDKQMIKETIASLSENGLLFTWKEIFSKLQEESIEVKDDYLAKSKIVTREEEMEKIHYNKELFKKIMKYPYYDQNESDFKIALALINDQEYLYNPSFLDETLEKISATTRRYLNIIENENPAMITKKLVEKLEDEKNNMTDKKIWEMIDVYNRNNNDLIIAVSSIEPKEKEKLLSSTNLVKLINNLIEITENSVSIKKENPKIKKLKNQKYQYRKTII